MPCQVWELSWLPQKKETPTAGHKFCHGPSLGRKEIPHRQGSGTRRGEACTQGQGRGRTHLLPSSSFSWEPPWSTLSRPAGPRGSTECPNPHCGSTEGHLCTKGCCLWMEGGQWESANISTGAHTCTQLGLCPHVTAHTHIHMYTRAHRL